MRNTKRKIRLIKNKHISVLFVIFFFSINSFSQLVFYQATLKGGTTGAGFSTALGSGSGSFDIYIEPGSAIKKAWLFAQRQGYPEPATIIINGVNYIFDSTLMITAVPQSGSWNTCSPLAVDVIDVTNDINPAITTYNITIPVTNQNSPYPCWGYSAVYLFVLYENNSLPLHNSVILLNNKQLVGNDNYTVTNINPINTNYPVGFSIFSDRIDEPTDGAFASLNGNLLGLIGGSDAVNSLWTSAGVKGHFYYQNNTLFGLDDDTSDSLMSGTDGLADVSSYIVNNSTTFNYSMQYQVPNNHTNFYDAWFLTYTTPCDTFTTTATTNLDTICEGDSVQLTATGGASYSWFSAFSTFNDSTLANPMATPTQTTTYIVTIKNDSGCVKTEQVKIWVNPAPQPDTIIITPQNCGNQDGSITVGNIANGASPFTYQLTDLATGNLQSQISNSFNNLTAGNYLLQITDANGCIWQSDTLLVPMVNNTQANFITNPQPSFANPTKPVGKAPLPVDFINQSTLATNYEWFIIYQATGDTIFTTNLASFTYEFIVGGTFELCLIAYNNLPVCADTVCKIISIDDDLSIIISNLLTPNGDGKNDTWFIANVGKIDGCSVLIFNRWGSKLFETTNYNNDWEGTYNGKNLPDGAYFYVIVCEDQTYKGPLTLLRTAK